MPLLVSSAFLHCKKKKTMSHTLTLVASAAASPLEGALLERAAALCENHEIHKIREPVWLAEGKAADIGLSDTLDNSAVEALRDLLAPDKVDFFINPAEHRRKSLLLADMDSTIVTGETLDELAGYAGLKDHISAITARAMNGELDFEAALRERVKLLKGLPVSKLDETLEETKLSVGAEIFVKTMAHNGAKCVLVSGGFTFFTEAIAGKAGFHAHHGNTLGLEEGTLNGEVIDPILDKSAKLNFLNHYTRTRPSPLATAPTTCRCSKPPGWASVTVPKKRLKRKSPTASFTATSPPRFMRKGIERVNL